MTDLISLAKDKLDDPILMQWALDRYRDARHGLPRRREAMDRVWFDDLTLRHWLDSEDSKILARLFIELPAERFATLGQAIGERWRRWSGNLACHATPVFARFEPELALECFASPGGERQPDVYIVIGIVRAVPFLAPEAGRALLAVLVEGALEAKQGGLRRDAILTELIPVGLKIDRQSVVEVIRKRLHDGADDGSLDQTLHQVSRGLFGHDRYRQLAAEIRKGKTRQRFQPLAALFRDGAPLERLDQLSRAEGTLTDLTGLVDIFCVQDDRSVLLAADLSSRAMRSPCWSA